MAGVRARAMGRGVAATAAAVQPAVIVGGGRIGTALLEMGDGVSDVLLRRGDAWPSNAPEGPIYVCTRNDALAGVVAGVPEARRGDLVFTQNGMLQPWLDEVGLGDATQCLLYLAVAKLGEKPTDGVTDANPEGLTAAHGKWAQAMADRLAAGGMSCKVLPKGPFTAAMFEKLIWICAFMLVGARHKCTVGEVEAQHAEEVGRLIKELLAAATSECGASFDDADTVVVPRLMAYARSVAHFPTAVKEFEWRNGFFHGLSAQATAAGRPDPCPTHTAWLAEVGAI